MMSSEIVDFWISLLCCKLGIFTLQWNCFDVLFFSVAILKYIADKYGVADHWYPKDLQKRALVDRYMAWQHLNLRLFGSMVFRVQVKIRFSQFANGSFFLWAEICTYHEMHYVIEYNAYIDCASLSLISELFVVAGEKTRNLDCKFASLFSGRSLLEKILFSQLTA